MANILQAPIGNMERQTLTLSPTLQLEVNSSFSRRLLLWSMINNLLLNILRWFLYERFIKNNTKYDSNICLRIDFVLRFRPFLASRYQ